MLGGRERGKIGSKASYAKNYGQERQRNHSNNSRRGKTKAGQICVEEEVILFRMRIIFSRKGFDTSAGGIPSPIIDGKPVSLPIPSGQPSKTLFDDLPQPIPQMLHDLGRSQSYVGRSCHVDPDIDFNIRPDRRNGWRGALGQVGAADTHLRNAGVCTGDIFLFWGLFADVAIEDGRWRYVGRPHHRIFGWLEIAEILPVTQSRTTVLESHPWLEGHPHTLEGWGPGNNTIYLASERSSVSPGLAGFGTMPLGHLLTANVQEKKSLWRVPDWLHIARGGTGMTFHPPARWLDHGLLQAAGRGQEFVADIGSRVDALAWVQELLENS